MRGTDLLRTMILALAGLAGSGSAPAEVMVGIVPSDGVVMFVKRFPVSAGTTIVGAEFPNNDPRTIFPEVVLVRGASTALNQGTVVARAENVQEAAATPGVVRVPWAQEVQASQSANYYVAVRVPAGSGKRGPGDGPAIGAVDIEVPSGSFLASETEGNLTPIGIDLSIRLLTSGAGKVETSDAGELANRPRKTFLDPVNPNPASHLAMIHFGVAQPTEVTLGIYDIAGREVRLLAGGLRDSGVYAVTWDGRDDSGADVAAGVYIAKLQAGGKVVTQKVVLTK